MLRTGRVFLRVSRGPGNDSVVTEGDGAAASMAAAMPVPAAWTA